MVFKPENSQRIFNKHKLIKIGTEFYLLTGSVVIIAKLSIGLPRLWSLTMTNLTKKSPSFEINPLFTEVIKNLQGQTKFNPAKVAQVKNKIEPNQTELQQTKSYTKSNQINITNSESAQTEINKSVQAKEDIYAQVKESTSIALPSNLIKEQDEIFAKDILDEVQACPAGSYDIYDTK